MKLRYFSHSSFLITLDTGVRLLIDPFLDGNPTSPVGALEVEAEYILLTHGHGDHFGDTLSIAKRCDSLCICENELANYIASKGVKAHNMHIGGSHTFDFGKIKLVQALHSSTTPDKECTGSATGIILFIQDKIIYHMGDTGLFMDMKLIGELHPIDYLLVPIGDNFTMGIDDAVMACSFVKPGCAIPIHYNTFDIIQSDPSEFKKKVEKLGLNCQVLEFGQEIIL
ncbi:MAG: metal-dependent hydrolase [Proteobacteria bacterium]|nr:metal-dependent hydrolase [Pseudomonadota bacterium]MBU1585874.1 metal-dependent hydrolase [Pseudomonadota bacterium]MBU2452535.1 metal-dependent hydrolase [Pseudomonadota bacterium]MBU2627969.1 metal-dependent hydrolase [Pseudomonadota bacterium]